MFYYNETTKNIFRTRFDAVVDSEPCLFYFFDKEFSQVNWQQNPTKSLSTLYLERAQHIRQDYEYVILAYSGGHDSSQVLETFYYNNIHIDEILLVGAFSQDSSSDSDENHNKEIYLQALPTLNKFHLPNTKVTQVDYTTYFNDINNFKLIEQYGSDWTKHIGSYYSVHNLFWNNLKRFVGETNDKKTAVVFGGEKPNFQIHSVLGFAYTQFDDNSITSYGNFQKNENFNRINFFTSLETTELMRKQLHLILKFYIEKVVIDKSITHEFFLKYYTEIIHKIIYNLKCPITYKSRKSSNNVLSLRDQYIVKDKNTPIYKIYQDGIKHMKDIKNFMKEIPKNSFTPSTNFVTRTYRLSESLWTI